MRQKTSSRSAVGLILTLTGVPVDALKPKQEIRLTLFLRCCGGLLLSLCASLLLSLSGCWLCVPRSLCVPGAWGPNQEVAVCDEPIC